MRKAVIACFYKKSIYLDTTLRVFGFFMPYVFFIILPCKTFFNRQCSALLLNLTFMHKTASPRGLASFDY